MDQIITKLRPELDGVFKHLHENPEISWKEYETRAYLKEVLSRHDCKVREFENHAGLVADFGEGQPRVAVRGDMDALWQKVDGEYRACHSCGHDAHMTMALGSCLYLHEAGVKDGVRLIFQPAEEKGAGALEMVRDKVLDGITHLYGVHLRPIQELRNGKAAPAILHGACSSIVGRINGEDAHAGRPHLTANAIEIGATIVNRLQGIHLNPMVPYSVKLTRFQAGGSATNIIPGSADFSIDMRAQTNETMTALMEGTRAVLEQTAEAYGVAINFEQHMGTAASEVHPEAQEMMALAIRDVLGDEGYHEAVVTGGGDDFHFYTIEQPELKATMLALGCDLHPGLHHPKMTFEHESIYTGIRIMAGAVKHTLAGS